VYVGIHLGLCFPADVVLCLVSGKHQQLIDAANEINLYRFHHEIRQEICVNQYHPACLTLNFCSRSPDRPLTQAVTHNGYINRAESSDKGFADNSTVADVVSFNTVV